MAGYKDENKSSTSVADLSGNQSLCFTVLFKMA